MYCYRFPSEAVFLEKAAAEGLVNEGLLVTSGHGWAVDPIGIIQEGGVYGGMGVVITPPTVLPGYHVNTAGLAPEAWDEYLVVVNSATRVFLGGPIEAPGADVLELIV